jgi:hypothetical protein
MFFDKNVLLLNFMAPTKVSAAGQSYKTFYGRNLQIFCYRLENLSLAKPFQPSLMIVGKARGLPWCGVP